MTNQSMFAQFAQDMDAALNNGDEQDDFVKGDARAVLARGLEPGRARTIELQRLPQPPSLDQAVPAKPGELGRQRSSSAP